MATLLWNALGTLFLLPLITCVLTTTAIRHDVGAGAVESAPWLHSAYPRTAALPARRVARGAVLGALAVLVLGPLATLALVVGGRPSWTTPSSSPRRPPSPSSSASWSRLRSASWPWRTHPDGRYPEPLVWSLDRE